jgi:hypothetical protein
MSDKIHTLHPEGKNGVNIDASKYYAVKDTLLEILREHPEITYQEMNKLANIRLRQNFSGSIPWYVVTVKLDLEAREVIERVPKSSPHKIRMKT